jgi:hypothetical protein
MEEEQHTRRAQWEQEQLNELQGLTVPEELALMQDDKIEQLKQIDTVQQMAEEQQTERNNEELIQLEQWENVAFLVQQLNQN